MVSTGPQNSQLRQEVSNDVQLRLMSTVYACMRPLARVLMRSGITYRSFAEIAKVAFVQEALLESDTKGRTTNASRVAVRTGLSRKEVRRISEGTRVPVGSSGPTDPGGPLARLLHIWHFDRRFLNKEGLPLDLSFDEGEPTFTDLVRSAAGDVPPGAVRAELLRGSAMIELDNGAFRPTKRYFVPSHFDEKAVTVMSAMLFPFLSGLDHNSNPERTVSGFIQRVAYAKLRAEDRDDFRVWSREQVTRFLESIDDWLTLKQIPLDTEGEAISAVGAFFYEGPEVEDIVRSVKDQDEKSAP